MKIYFGISKNKEFLQDLESQACAELILLSGDFRGFLAATPAKALYLPFALLERWGITPKVHISQVFDIPEDAKEKFPGVSFIATGPALKEDDPKTADYEASILFDCLIAGIREKNVNSLAIWGGFFEDYFDYELCVEKLNSSIERKKTGAYNAVAIALSGERRKKERRGVIVQQKRLRMGDAKLYTYMITKENFVSGSIITKVTDKKSGDTLKPTSEKNYEYKKISVKTEKPSKKPR